MTETGRQTRKMAHDAKMQKEKLKQEADIARRDRWVNFASNIVGHLIPSFRLTKSLDKKGDSGVKAQVHGVNDPAWYKRYIGDLDKFTNVSTYFRHGTSDAKMCINGGCSPASATAKVSGGMIPGILAIHYYPTIGPANTYKFANLAESPINMILMRTKEQVLKSNSRSSVPYEASDLGYNFIACASIIQLICEAERALLVAQTYSGQNNFFAKRLLTALGWDADAVINNLPDFRKFIMLAKSKFNSAMVCPADLTLYQRTMYIVGNVFADHDTPEYISQMYAYVPKGYYLLKSDTTALDFIRANNTTGYRASPKLWYDEVSLAMQRLAETPDYVEMFADLRSAFGDNLLHLAEEIDELGAIALNCDEENRLQIHNIQGLPAGFTASVITPIEPADADLGINQDANGYIWQGRALITGIVCTNTWASASAATFVGNLINAYSRSARVYDSNKVEVTGDNILEYTRGVTLYTCDIASDTTTLQLEDYGTEIVSGFTIYDRANAYVGSSLFIPTGATTNNTTVLKYEFYDTTFDWAPPSIYVFSSNPTSSEFRWNGQLYHPFIIDEATFGKINEACLLSLFYIDSSAFKR